MALGCCNEHNCRRTTPIHIVIGELSGRIYVVTRATVHKTLDNDRAVFRADERHDITDQFGAFIRDNREAIEAILCE
jgi:hypothetical protein